MEQFETLPECAALASLPGHVREMYLDMDPLHKAAMARIPPKMLTMPAWACSELCKISVLELEHPKMRMMTLEQKRAVLRFSEAKEDLQKMLEGAEAVYQDCDLVHMNGQCFRMNAEHRALCCAYMVLVERYDARTLIDLLDECVLVQTEMCLERGVEVPEFIVEAEIKKYIMYHGRV
jgi:hypothetical protein